jgi:hypothetical protein
MMLWPTVVASGKPVITSKNYDTTPAASGTHLAWAQSTTRAPKHFNAFVKRFGKKRHRLNRRGTQGFLGPGGIDAGTLAYSERAGRRGNIFFYDLATRKRSRPQGVNTKKHEWGASIWGSYILFARTRFSDVRETVLLLDSSNGTTRKLAKAPGSAIAQPGTVDGNYAAWSKCPVRRRCNTALLDIAADDRTKLPNPRGRVQLPAAVDERGVVYYAEYEGVFTGCGSGTTIFRDPLHAKRKAVLRLPSGFGTSTISPARHNGRRVLYYDRIDCSANTSDIYRTPAR